MQALAGTPARLAAALRPVYLLLARKYWVDELYAAFVIRPFYLLCGLFAWIDAHIVDGAVNGVRNLTIFFSNVYSWFDRWVVDLGVNAVGWSVKGLSWVFRRFQNGFVQSYAAAMLLGTFVLLSLYLILLK